MNAAKPHVSYVSYFLLMVLFSATSLLALLMMPALPHIADFYHVPLSDTARLVSNYLLGYAAGPMLYPPLADRFGRCWALYIGFTIAILGACLTVLSTHTLHFELLVIGRILIALGASSGLVITMVLVTDRYEGNRARKVMSTLLLTFSMVPFISQSIGGYLTNHYGWQSLNAMSLCYVIFSFICTLFISETLSPADKKPLELHRIHRRYLPFFRQPIFFGYLLLYSFAGTASYIFNTLGSMLAIHDLRINPMTYGVLCIIPGVGVMTGSLLSTHLANYWHANRVILTGIIVLFLSSLAFLILIKLGCLNTYSLFGSGFFMVTGALMINPNASMQAITHSTDRTSASAVLNTFGIMGIAFLLQGASLFEQISVYALPICLISLSIISLFILYLLRHTK